MGIKVYHISTIIYVNIEKGECEYEKLMQVGRLRARNLIVVFSLATCIKTSPISLRLSTRGLEMYFLISWYLCRRYVAAFSCLLFLYYPEVWARVLFRRALRPSLKCLHLSFVKHNQHHKRDTNSYNQIQSIKYQTHFCQKTRQRKETRWNGKWWDKIIR